MILRYLRAMCLAVVALSTCAIAAPAPDRLASWRLTRFATLGSKAGLPHAATTAIVQAADGAMWIGTRGGLARYDGQRVRTYKQSADDLHSLPDNYVRTLMPLPDGGVLVGTNVGGVARFSPATDSFVRLHTANGAAQGTRVLGFTPDGQGGAWIASSRGIHRYDARRDLIVEGPRLPGGAAGAFAVYRDDQGVVWAGADEGLFRHEPGAPGFVQVTTPALGDVWAIAHDAAGRLWIGTGSNGVFIRSPDGTVIQPPTLAGQSAQIGGRTIRAFAPGPGGRMWVATDGMGLLLVDPKAGFLPRVLRNRAGDLSSLAGDTVRGLARDRTGRIWAATEVGASHTDPLLAGTFSIGEAMPDPARSLAASNVRSVIVDRRDRIWLGMTNGLVDRLDPATGQVRHVKLQGRHAGQDMKSVIETPEGDMLVGGRGVVRIDGDTLAQQPMALPGLGDFPVISMKLSGATLFIGTYRGLFAWSAATRRMIHYRHIAGDASSLANDEVVSIVGGADGLLWIATPGGVSRLDPTTGRFSTLRNDPADRGSLPQDYAGSILHGERGLWIGTYGGVARGRRVGDTWRFRAITEAQGLANDNVASLLADQKGRIWAASANGVSIIDPASGRVRTMSVRDGVPDGAFNQQAAAITREGDLLFGSTAGLVVIRPDILLSKPSVRPQSLVVTSAELGGRRLGLSVGSATGDRPIPIGSGQRMIRLGFALIDYAAPEEVRYSYRLEGFDDGWVTIPAGTPASATYTNLPGGDYALLLRAEVPGINAHVVERRFRLVIARAWYERWPVRLAGVALLLLSFVGVGYLWTLVLRRRARALQAAIDAGTQELRSANARLDHLASTDPLTGLANRRTLMTRLQQEGARIARIGGYFSFAILDVDHFKHVNDLHGHQAGDAVLQALADRIAGAARAVDCVARYGGEEIAIILPDTGLDDARAMLERLRETIAATPIVTDHGTIPITITVSVGAACFRPHDSITETIESADAALYEAKLLGRNRVAVHRPGHRPPGTPPRAPGDGYPSGPVARAASGVEP